MRLVSGASSHVGLVRRQNEDSFVVGGGIFAVCDGMGGARAGEVASEAACQTLIRMPETGVVDAISLERAVHEANANIVAQSRRDRGLQGMGTTMTAAVATPTGLAFVHVGDSRAYHLRGGTLTQVTDDHSLVAELVRRGQLSPAQAAVHPHRSIITRALGTEDAVEPDVFELSLEPGDRVLFCSDGLSGMVPEDLIGRLLGEGDDPQAIADSLVGAALNNGGEDNVTVVVIVVDSDDPLLESPPDDATLEFGPALRQAVTEGVAGDDAASGRGVTPSWFRSRRVLVAAGVVVVLVIAALVAFAVFNSTVYYVGTSAGSVALFRGIPAAPLGVELYAAVEVTPTRYEALLAYQRARVDAHELVTKDEGLRFVRSLSAGQ
jgi:serine/threonine protein phosphatase PrpC